MMQRVASLRSNSLMRTCAQHVVPPPPYLTDVLRKLANGWDQDSLEELLPDRWQLLHGGGENNESPTVYRQQPSTASV